MHADPATSTASNSAASFLPAILASFLAVCHLALPEAFAQEEPSDSRTAAYQSRVSQEQLRLESRRQEMEMLELLEQLGQYDFTRGEHGALRNVLSRLDGVVEGDMKSVIDVLREASRREDQGDIEKQLVAASAGQKVIQSHLRSMADRLLLEKDAATVREQIRQLAVRQKANFRDTERLAALAADPGDIPEEKSALLSLAQAEQTSLHDEIRLLEESLARLAEHSTTDRDAFRGADRTFRNRRVIDHSEEAADRIIRRLPQASDLQDRVYEGLVATLVALEQSQPREERLRELSQEIERIAREQEQLAQSTPQAESPDQESLRDAQEELSTQMEMARRELEQVDRQSSREAEDIEKQSEDLGQRLDEEENLLDDADQVAEVADTQTEIAEQLDELSESLREKAREIAQRDASDPREQAQALSDKLERLAREQEDLAEETSRADESERRSLRKQQQDLAREVKRTQRAIEKLSPEAGEQTKQASEKSRSAEKTLAQRGSLKEEETRDEVARTQEDIAEQLQSASDALQQEADALAQSEADEASRLAEEIQSLAREQRDLQQAASETAEQANSERADAEQADSERADAEQADSERRQSLQQQQSELAEQIQQAQRQARDMNADAAAQTEQAREEAQSAARQLRDQDVLSDAQQQAALEQAQQTAADQLEAAGESLRAQAERLAQRETSPRSTLREAVHQVLNARSQMQLAERQMEAGNESEPVKDRLKSAREALAEASELTEPLGDLVPESVGEALAEGQENLAESQAELGDEGEAPQSPTPEAAEALAEARDNADEALAGLQQAAAQLARGEASQLAQAEADSGQESGEEAEQEQGDPSGSQPDFSEEADVDDFIEGSLEDADVASIISRLRRGQRNALELLEQEKVSPEYQDLVEQYIRNLADGEVPDP